VHWGEAASTIVSMAQSKEADLIVIGHQGHSAIRDLLLGSVTKKVIDHAHCSVLVVRDPSAR
jgi:nucleotide-binding universal stress UspA family protein